MLTLRLVAVLVIPALLATAAFLVPEGVRAAPLAPPPGVSVTPASISAAPGGTVTVTLAATAPDAGLGAWTVDVSYDPTVLHATSCTAPGFSACNAAYSGSGARVTGASATGLTGTAVLGTVTFTVVGAAGSSSPLHLVVVTFTALPNTATAAVTADGQVTVAAAGSLVGDANSDCAVDVQDFSILLGSFAKPVTDPRYDPRANFDGVGLVDIVDFSILVSHFGSHC